MQKPTEVLNIFEKYTPLIDNEIKTLLAGQDKLLMYDMMSYFFGYIDDDLSEAREYGGKRFRPGLALLCADFYGKMDDVMGAATAIEIFHNFTLIHDDIEDNDPIRRGRPTVWKKWGISHAINTGDAQLILAFRELNLSYADKPELLTKIYSFLSEIFQGVAEGQFMDFNLAESALGGADATVEQYLEMIKRKSAVLVAASAKIAGIIAGVPESELENLWNYGLNLGFAYQLNDDLASIWGKAGSTGKVEAKDLEERKKTLPIIYLYGKLNENAKKRFATLYGKTGQLTHDEISEIKSLLDEKDADEYVWIEIQKYLKASEEAVNKLNISTENKQLLLNINKALIPNLKIWDC